MQQKSTMRTIGIICQAEGHHLSIICQAEAEAQLASSVKLTSVIFAYKIRCKPGCGVPRRRRFCVEWDS